MDRFTRVVVRGSNPTFMNVHSNCIYRKKFDLMHGTHMYTVMLNTAFSCMYPLIVY